MKKTIFIFLLLLMQPAISYGKISEDKVKKIEIFCDDVRSYSQFFMEKRQEGTDISFLVSVINSIESVSVSEKQFMKYVLYEAYSEPVWFSEEEQNKAVIEFGNQQYLFCVRAIYK